ncbi:hypothetical protein OEZ86_012369 [Tetradesmus obliquus]|nr:hypothetical protein OEZ86_012369 [Tetradesmus obliquus]
MEPTTSRTLWHRLEFAAVRRKTGGLSGYGFALLESDTGALVATGCGPVQPGVTYNQAALIGLLQGLTVARQHDLQRLHLQTDSSTVYRQLQRAAPAAGSGSSLNSQLHAAAAATMAELQQLQVHEVERWHNGLAIIQAEFATQLLQQLRKVAAAAPSKYSQVAGQLGLLLQLPLQLRRVIETADDFVQTAAEVTAARCGANPADVLAALHATSGAASSAQPAVSARSGKLAGAAELQLVPGLVPFSMGRTFSPREGAAYAVAAAAQAGAGSPTDAPQDLTAGLAVELEGDEAGEAAPGSSRLVGGRVVGRHRLNQRLLVVGFNQLPGGWEPGQPLQPASAGGSGSKHAAEQRSTAAADNQEAHQLAQQVAGAEAVATPEAHGSVVDSISGSIISIGEDLLLPSWAVTGSAAGSSEGAGLGTSRYTLPPVASDTATHLLQFDGASRGNPGRAGYGWVLFDLASGRLAGRGCMSLRYRQTSGQAEFEGLLAGLAAARDARVACLAVQGDSALVLDALMYRRGISSKELGVSYHKACQLLAGFEHVDFQYIPREQNSLADRLAQMSMDIDTALHALLRTGGGGVAGLQLVTKAARLAKRQHVLEVLLSQYSFPLLLVVLLQRVMSISPEQLLERLQAKAASLGDANPWLVQEVRKVVEAGLPDHAQQLGSVMLDSRRYALHSIRLLRKCLR